MWNFAPKSVRTLRRIVYSMSGMGSFLLREVRGPTGRGPWACGEHFLLIEWFGVEPVGAGREIDFQRDCQVQGMFHLFANEIAQFFDPVGGRFEHQFVVDLQEDLPRMPL